MVAGDALNPRQALTNVHGAGRRSPSVCAVQVLADNGRYVLAEAGARLLFFERRILPPWTVYVPTSW